MLLIIFANFSSQEKEQLERRLRELEQQEILIETSDESSSTIISSNNSSSHSHQAVSSAGLVSSSGSILDERPTSSRLSQVTSASSSLSTAAIVADAADDIARRVEFQNRLLSGDHHIQMSTVFDYARIVEQRKREIEMRLSGSSSGLIEMAVVRPSGTASLASCDSSSAINQAAVVDKQTVYSSDSGIGSGSNRLNSVASVVVPEPSSLLKKPINLAVEQLNSEIQGFSFYFKKHIF